ncbi:MAG: acetyl-CoA carboxylase, biotin carboxyl carrier protein [Minwuia thermotolerans]|nr:MAG: acetyl-CoA carboxylase, biotin carboxyl carrier protein [Minwuia thermotolerans]
MTKLKVDVDTVRELANLLADTGLTEIEIEQDDIKLRLERKVQQTVMASVPAPAPAPQAVPAAAPGVAAAAPSAADAHPGSTEVLSPMVGTAYVAPEPGAPDFVKVGDTVTQGQTLLIIEAMKTMNPVPAPKAGKVVAVLIENEQPVEYEQPLFLIQ